MMLLLLHAFLGITGLALLLAIFFLLLRLSSRRNDVIATQGLPEEFMSANRVAEAGTVESVKKKAVIRCDAIYPAVPYRFTASGFSDCSSMNAMFGGNMACAHGCLGLGSCAELCPSDSIHINDGVICVLDSCTGCGHCLSACPKGLITLVPVDEASSFPCSGAKNPEVFEACPTAGNFHKIDFALLSKSGFKRS